MCCDKIKTNTGICNSIVFPFTYYTHCIYRYKIMLFNSRVPKLAEKYKKKPSQLHRKSHQVVWVPLSLGVENIQSFKMKSQITTTKSLPKI